jgi:hypothetical protein
LESEGEEDEDEDGMSSRTYSKQGDNSHKWKTFDKAGIIVIIWLISLELAC